MNFLELFVSLDFEKKRCIILEKFVAHFCLYFLLYIYMGKLESLPMSHSSFRLLLQQILNLYQNLISLNMPMD